MPAALFRTIIRSLLLAVRLAAVTLALAGRAPVPFPHPLGVIVPACLLGMLAVQ